MTPNNDSLTINITDESSLSDPCPIDDDVALWIREESPMLVIINDDSIEPLKLYQYPSLHSSWGIHSQVWDGGLATLCYILYSQQSFIREWRDALDNEPLILVDLGSGTGVVGIGANIWMVPENSSACADNTCIARPHVIVTDLLEALPLLIENCNLNQIDKSRGCCEAIELFWEEKSESSQIHLFLERLLHKFPDIHRLLIVGSDVIYRPNLFRPLLCSIQQFFNYFSLPYNTAHRMDVRCIIGAHSIRTHLNQFYDIAQGPEFSFQLSSLATVNTESTFACTNSDVVQEMNGAYTIHLPCEVNEVNSHNSFVGKGIVHIFELSL